MFLLSLSHWFQLFPRWCVECVHLCKAFVIFLLAESSLFVDIILEVKKLIAFVKKELVDETPLRTTGPLPFFALFERVVDDNDDDAPVVVIVDDEDEEAAVRFIFSTAFF